MKKSIKLLALLSLLSTSAFGLASCGGKTPSGGNSSSSSQEGGHSLEGADLIINYYRFDENYTDWGIWSWGDNADTGLLFDPTFTRTFEKTGDWKWVTMAIDFDKPFDAYTKWNFPSLSQVTRTQDNFSGIIIRDKDGNKDVDADRTFNWTNVDENGVLNAYFVTSNTQIFYDVNDVPTSPIADIYFTNTKKIRINTYFAMDLSKEEVKVVDDEGRNYAVADVDSYTGYKVVTLEDDYADYTKPLTLIFNDEERHSISFKAVYNSSAFNALYEYTEKDLGAVVSNATTTFKLWSPSATSVKLNVYESADATTVKDTFDMTLGEKGVWSYTSNSNMHGTYYTYTVTVGGNTNAEVADPYAASSNANGKRSLVVDWSQIESTLVEAPATKHNVSVYEMHVRDFSMDESWNGSEENRGRYLGLAETGTKLATNEPTGFDYVKSLGVTHVQLQPVYDFKSVDETKLNDAELLAKHRGGVYNWGYDPYCYSSLEGSYSSDPNDGFTRINEFRQAVSAYNEAGIGVIMDVVYNHMPGESDSLYNLIMPDYYFRTNSYSGAGSDLATENAMVKRMMVQTTEQLMKHYGLSGFRFDLAGLIAQSAIKAVDSNIREFKDDALLYGEGWDMFKGDKYLGNTKVATAGSLRNTTDINKETKFGFFNDTYRDGMKGSVFGDTEKGYLQMAYGGDPDDLEVIDDFRTRVLSGLSGTAAASKYTFFYPYSSINYTECHDNLTLHDKLLISNPELSEEERNQLQATANVITALSTGISFYQLGGEFGRSKEMPASWTKGEDAVTEKISSVTIDDETRYFVNDSYNFSDEINAVDWSLVKTNASMVESFKKVMALRGNSDLDTLTPDALKNIDVSYMDMEDLGYDMNDDDSVMQASRVLAYTFANSKLEGSKVVSVIVNVSDNAITLPADLCSSASAIYVDGSEVASAPTSLGALSYLVYVA